MSEQRRGYGEMAFTTDSFVPPPPPKRPYKYDQDKPRLDLVPPGLIEAVGVVRTYGISKYDTVDGWQNVEPERYTAALMRHLCGTCASFCETRRAKIKNQACRTCGIWRVTWHF